MLLNTLHTAIYKHLKLIILFFEIHFLLENTRKTPERGDRACVKLKSNPNTVVTIAFLFTQF